MRKIKLNKPLIESPIPPSSTNVYWVDIDEKTGKLKAIKEFQNNKWTTILNTNNLNEDFIDLGLPSGTLWATKNLGAENETGIGLYYAWSLTQGYTPDTIPTDYDSFWGPLYENPKTQLAPEDDAATVYNSQMCMPTKEQIQELRDNTNILYVQKYNGESVVGYILKSKINNACIYIPDTGAYSYSGGVSHESRTYLLGRDSYGSYSGYCYSLGLNSNSIYGEGIGIKLCNIRPVKNVVNIIIADHSVQLKPKDNEIWYQTKDNSIFTVQQQYFDSQIISNIVSNGVGVITFSSPLLKLNDYAFDDESNAYIGRTNLVRLVLPDCIESFGQACFRGLNNLEVNIPKNLKGEIPWDCFYNCRSLKHIVIPDGITSLGNQEYGGYCFYQCESLESIYLPEGITVIYDQTFAECDALKEIVLPSTITKLGSSIFEGLPSIQIVYRGTIEQWNAIDKDTDWFYSLTNEQPIVHCIDGDVIN